jgi:hypothetical protein
MKWKQFILGGIIAGIIIEIISYAFSWLTQTITNYNVMELAGMRPITDPISVLYFVYPWVLGFILSFAFPYFQKSFEGTNTPIGLKFGFLMWIVISIPSAFLVFASMNYPLGFTINSVLGSLIYLLVAGGCIGKFSSWTK